MEAKMKSKKAEKQEPPCSRCQGLGWRAPDGPEGCAKCGGVKNLPPPSKR